MGESTSLISLGSLLTIKNLVLIISIQVLLGIIKTTLNKFKLLKNIVVEIVLPYIPILMGVGAALIPNIIDAADLGSRIIFGIAIGGISGQVWKAVWKNSNDLLKGKLGK